MSLIDAKNEIKMRRDNVILRVNPEQKSYYMGLGYNVVDQSGNVVEETTPTDIASLQRFYKDSKKRIAELEEEIKTLKAQKQVEKKEPAVETNADIEVEAHAPVETKVSTRKRKNK